MKGNVGPLDTHYVAHVLLKNADRLRQKHLAGMGRLTVCRHSGTPTIAIPQPW